MRLCVFTEFDRDELTRDENTIAHPNTWETIEYVLTIYEQRFSVSELRQIDFTVAIRIQKGISVQLQIENEHVTDVLQFHPLQTVIRQNERAERDETGQMLKAADLRENIRRKRYSTFLLDYFRHRVSIDV